MKKKYIFNRLCGFILFLCIIVSISFINENVFHAYAMSQETAVFSQTADFSTNLENEVVFMKNTDKSGNVILIEGENNNNFSKQQSISDFTDIKYISNANYFLSNPKHHENTIDNTDNEAGTCTTVAMQMLLGYHNYYSDRRLIPNLNGESLQFLDENYGNLLDNPLINPSRANAQGRATIGTEDDVYHEIFDLTWISDWYGIGQAIGLVKDGAIRFVNKHATSISNEVMLESGIFSKDDAIADINNNRPIIVGFIPILSSADSFHVVVAYGYAKLNGENGFFVHYGWGDSGTQVWVPESWLGFQIRMEIDHIHSLEDTTENVNNAYRRLYCEECGFSTVDTLFEVENSTLQRIKYPLASDISIPRTFNTYSEDTAINTSHTITAIGSSAFANQTQLTSVTISSSVTTISENAFAGCTNLTSINIPANVSLIGNGAFKGCNNLNITVSPDNTNYSALDNILYDKEKATIVGAGKVANDIIVPNTVTTILSNAFEDNNNLETVRFNTVPIIGDYAFAGCSTLYAVHFDTYSVPTVGTGVFLDDIFVLYVPYIAQDSFKTAFSEYAESVASVEVPMVFIVDGAVIETWTIYDGSTLGDLPTATKVGYDFVGWYDNVDSTGTLYQSGALLDTETGLTVYAAWTPKRYSVTLDANGGTVTGTNAIEVTYGSDFSVTATANRDGYTLEGWFDEGGTKYVTVNGESTRTWDKAENTTLYAQWIVERYEIQINDNGTITWLSEDGLSDEPCSIPYGAVLNAINLVKIFKDSSQGFKEGKIFDHFEYEDASIEWTSIPDFGEDGAIVTIIPVWIVEVHKIYFNTLTDIVVPEIIADYDADIALPTVSRVGYEFDGWYTSTSAGTKVNWTKMPDLTLNEQKDGSITLYAGWIENVYSVSYNANGGVGAMSATTHTYEGNELLALNTFTREIHNFIGWSTTSSGEVEYVDGASIKDLVAEGSGSLALYAVWKKKTYKIIYSNLYFGDVKAEVLKGTSYEKAEEEYYHGEGFDLTNIRGYFKADSPYSPHFHFLGWYTDLGLTTQITSIPKDKNADVIVYAKWRYDFDNPSRSGSYTITDAARFDQPYDQVWAGLTYNNLYTNLKNMGIEYLAITLKIKLYEIDDGYQCLFLYDGSGSDANLLWEKEIEHGGTGKSGTAKVYKTQIYIPIESIQNADYLYFRYRAHGAFDDDWVNVEIYYEMMYVTEKEDIDAVEFYWDYQDPYDDSDCIEV